VSCHSWSTCRSVAKSDIRRRAWSQYGLGREAGTSAGVFFGGEAGEFLLEIGVIGVVVRVIVGDAVFVGNAVAA